MFIEGAGAGEFALATLTVFIAMTASAATLGAAIPQGHLLNALVLAALFGFTLFMLRLFKSQLGGLSGDTLGALGELSENLFMLLVATWSGLYTS
jgi:cobalamin synthase